MSLAARIRPVVQGHRGFRAAWPENTLAGFVAALRAGADAIELDVGLTCDGIVVVSHDPVLNPDLARGADGTWITPPGPIIFRSTLEQLRAYDVGRARPDGPVARAFPRQRAVDGARVPTLAEVFAATAAFDASIDVELKTDPAHADRTATPQALAEAVVGVAIACDALDRLALRSFDWRALRHAARAWPDVPLTWLTEAGAGPQALADRPGATWAPDHRGLTRAEIEQAKALGLRVIPWTVNEAADLTRLIAWGADGVCTDEVAMALATVR